MSRKRGGRRHRKPIKAIETRTFAELMAQTLEVRYQPEQRVTQIRSCASGLTWELWCAKVNRDGSVSASYRRFR